MPSNSKEAKSGAEQRKVFVYGFERQTFLIPGASAMCVFMEIAETGVPKNEPSTSWTSTFLSPVQLKSPQPPNQPCQFGFGSSIKMRDWASQDSQVVFRR